MQFTEIVQGSRLEPLGACGACAEFETLNRATTKVFVRLFGLGVHSHF